MHDKVSAKFHNPGIVQMHQIFREQGIHIADRNVNSEVVDDVGILIGVDYFGKVVISQRKVCGINSFITPMGVVPFGPTTGWSLNHSGFNNQVSCN